MYVRDFGLLVRRADAPGSLLDYRRKIADHQTILARVRKMPDQSFDQAMRALWRPVQNNGPTMLSLACDNEKFIVDRDGGVRYGRFSLQPRFPAHPVELVRLDFGTVGVDTTVRPPQATKALPLRIGERTYKKGLGLHANAELAVWLDGRYQSFEAEVGVLPHVQGGGSVVFQVDVDGQRKFDSGIVRHGEAPRAIRVDVAAAKRLVLRVLDAGDGILNDAANWAEARLAPAGPGNTNPVFLSDLYARQEQCPVTRSRQLEDRWLPIIVNTAQSGGAVLRQRTWVAPVALGGGPPTPLSRPGRGAGGEGGNPWDSIAATRAVAVAELTLENPTSKPVDISFRLSTALSPDRGSSTPIKLHTAGKRILWSEGDRLLAMLDLAEAESLAVPDKTGTGTSRQAISPVLVSGDSEPVPVLSGTLTAAVAPSGVVLTGSLPAASTRRFVAYIPAWPARPVEHTQFPQAATLKENLVRYWEGLMSPAMQIAVPEPLLKDVFRATQVHCLMAARNEASGRRVAPWIASDAYGPLDTEAQAVVLGMGLVGHSEFARRGLDFFIAGYNADGLLVKGYTLMGTGQHLWTLAEQYALDPDRRWLERIAPEILKSCRWIVRQTEKTKRLDARSQRLPEYGLVPPGVLADWDRYAYYFYANAHFCKGLEGAAGLLAEVQPTEGEKLRRAAKEYRDNLLRAFRWQRSQMPVVPLCDGTFVSPCPSSLYCYGLTREFFGGVSATGHDVEVGGNHMIALGLLEPASRESDWIVDFLEDRLFLIDGIFGAYPAKENEADWFHRGGFAKLQPHYARTSDLHALRDDVKPFIRTYFNTLPVLLNRENLTFWEHMNNGGAWNKTHESAWFLQMTRTMLVMERGDELWLAPFVTSHWMKHGMQVSVRGAPTRFGPVGYTLRSAVAEGRIETVVDSPTRNPPARLVLRVRHPEGKPMRAVTIDGRPHADFDPAAEVIRLSPGPKPFSVRIAY